MAIEDHDVIVTKMQFLEELEGTAINRIISEDKFLYNSLSNIPSDILDRLSSYHTNYDNILECGYTRVCIFV